MSGHEVAIAGGGPTGMMLAGELALAGIDVAIFEQRPGQALAGSRAGGLHSRGIELLDQRGIADRFLSEGQTAQAAMFASTVLDMSDFPTRHPYSLGLWQNHIEQIMAEWVAELGVPTNYGREVTGFAQDDAGVDVELADGSALRARYLIGCDGGRSVIRKAAGIDFPGWDPTTSNLIAEVEVAVEPEWGISHTALGISSLNRMDDGPVRVLVTEQEIGSESEPTLRDLSEALTRVYGTDYGIHSPTWISRFTDMTRQAASYREGRVLLAGDSAHIHYPAGGQGLQNGMQDAVNLGWKLAQVIRGTSPDSLLDTYEAERHPAAARSIRHTMAQTALLRPEPRVEALRDAVAETMRMEEPRKQFAALISGLDVRYDLGDGHPLLGRRMPDLDLVTADGPRRVFTLLHDARPALINLGEAGAIDIGPWADRVQLVDARYESPWELPAIGAVPAPAAVLIRPDGHVAWVGEPGDPGLTEALGTWFG
ncbi:MAG TPA: FAD-dependent monooxygenase [Solirubrobacterales bacterium]|jgi:2-polyprenyl-6-methoxyphenol hydroxylase-like FAD-dependent oxidoreductase|nr:FAD-dependent monooxygenase [Solirubrobacterales bacterium]